MQCSLCHEEASPPHGYRFSSISVMGDGGRRVNPIVCASCSIDTNLPIRWCPKCMEAYEAPEGWREGGEDDEEAEADRGSDGGIYWRPVRSAPDVLPCPTHSLDPDTPTLECDIEDCDTHITSNFRPTTRGRVYCDAHYPGMIGCINTWCGETLHPDDPDSRVASGGYFACLGCRTHIRKPRWFTRNPIEWDYRESCSCRGCSWLRSHESDRWPGDPIATPTDGMTICHVCERNIASSDRTITSSDMEVCHWCAHGNIHDCTSCGEAAYTTELTFITGSSNRICGPCAESNPDYRYCDMGCRCWYPAEYDCGCDGVHAWNYSPPEGFKFLTATGQPIHMDRQAFMGFELEIEAQLGSSSRREGAAILRDIMEDYAYPVHDGTLLQDGQRGFEVVSHPFTYEWFTEHWPLIKELLKTYASQGYRSYEGGRCGMHIHISRAPMTDAHQMKFIRFIYGSTNMMMCVGQRGYRDAGLARFAPFDKEDRASFMQKIRSQTNPGVQRHYAALNANKAATLEARWFRGTLNPSSFRKNIEFIHAMWHFTRKFGFSSANEINFMEWLRSTPERSTYPTILHYLEREYVTRR